MFRRNYCPAPKNAETPEAETPEAETPEADTPEAERVLEADAVADNATAEGRAQNRRVSILIKGKE